nr:transporter substrate-binding domain-containing protein [Vibrio mexicanus]
MAFSKMENYQVSIVPVPWKRGLKLIETGRGFGLFPPYYYEDRRHYIHPYSRKILEEHVAVYCHPQVPFATKLPHWPSDFYGLTIGINDEFALGGKAFWRAVEEGKVDLKSAEDNRENILKLRSQRIDCYLNDRISILWQIRNMKNKGELPTELVFSQAAIVSTEHGHIGYTNTNLQDYPFKADFVAQFDDVIERMQRSGEVEEIVRSYLD